MNKIPILLLVTLLAIPFFGKSQDRYFVYFKDKSGSDYPYSLSNVSAFLSQASIDRRTKQGIEVDATDLPVHPQYVQRIAETAEVFFRSKWFNGVLVEMDSSDVEVVQGHPFVDSVRLIALGSRLVKASQQPQPTDTLMGFEPPPYVNASTDIQLLMMGADQMIADSIVGQGMTIAVFDNGFTGVNLYEPFEHLWQESRIIATKDFVENSDNVFQYGSHGTSVFSIIGAKHTTDESDYTGISHGAKFVLCVTEDNQAENIVEEYNWLLAAEYADSVGVDIINSSLGYRDFDLKVHDYQYDELDGRTAIISISAQMAARKGMLVVTSAGNSGRRNAPANSINHPADTDSILTVGSVNPDFSRSDFSSIGPTTDARIKPDLAAFGNGTAVVRGSGGIERGGGTSFAAPLIAGFAAGIWQVNQQWTAQQLINELRMASHKVSNPDNLLGYGVPYYPYLTENGTKAIDIDEVIAGQIQFYPNPFTGDTLYLKSSDLVDEAVTIKIVDPLGKSIVSLDFAPEDFQQIIEIPLEAHEQGIYYLFLQSGKAQKVIKLINL